METTISDYLIRTEQSLSNTLADDEIKAALAPFGYNQDKLDALAALCQATKTLNENQDAEYGDQYLANKNYLEARSTFNKTYKAHLKLARITFRNDPQAQQSLLLSGKRAEAYSEWLIQCETFYNNLDKKQPLKTAIEGFIPAAQITTAIAAIDDIKTIYQTFSDERNEAQLATQARDSSLDQLKREISDFYAVSKIALADNPQKLEKLGFIR